MILKESLMRQSIFMKKLYPFDSKLYYFFLHLVLFFYVYSVQFVWVPFGLGTRVFMGCIGFFIYFIEVFKNKVVFSKHFLNVCISLFAICFFSGISLFFNRTRDIEFFVKYPISIGIIIFASYFVNKMISFRNKDGNKILAIMQLFINVVIIQIIIALIMFWVHPARDFLNSIQVTSDQELKVLNETLGFRLNGFGSRFFGSGIINGFALILIASIIKFNRQSKIKVFKYSMVFLFIFIFGMMMARTTIIGVILAYTILIFPKKEINLNQIKNNLMFFFYLISVPVFIFVCVFYFLPELRDSLELALKFGFEIFVNYIQSNSIETASTSQMKEMYTWPTFLKTYLIGDGLYSDVINGTYYMQTDIGILRLIYYFGLFGVFSYLFFQFNIVRAAYSRNPKYKIMFYVIFLYCIILNFKGFTDLFFLNILFFINTDYQDNTKNEKNIVYNSISAK